MLGDVVQIIPNQMLACASISLGAVFPSTVHVMTRHGTRSPTKSYTGDSSYWDCESNY